MLALVVVHLLVALVLPVVARWNTRVAFAVGAVPPVLAVGWALVHAVPVLGGHYLLETVEWAPRLGLEFGFRLDSLALLMSFVVSGVGALVLCYSDFYFDRGSRAAKRSAPLLLAFAGVMLGLVLADHLITLYVFWELTTICSFLLVGQAGISRESRRSALQALMITSLGGLVMLLGFVVLGESAGTYRISQLIEHPPSTPAVPVAALLILVGAFSKSAQLPFHNWLPAAMVAPTPISAYLHAASMVKAGVFLVARLSPVFLGVAQWWIPVVVLGLATMLVGGWRALREYDLKRLLAYGTVSQLGFLMVLFGAATHISAISGATMLLAHALFKAALFLVVGVIDHNAGTRDIRELSGVGAQTPWLAAIAVVATASMAGLPPMLGFVAKEAAFEAFAHGGLASHLVEAGIVLGSALTVGYSLRLLWGAFATKPKLARSEVKATKAGLFLPTAIPALVSVALGVAHGGVDDAATDYADSVQATGDYHLALWHGLGLPLLFSLISVLGGILLHLGRGRIIEFRARLPRGLDAQLGYERIMGLLERAAVGVTGRVQAGSLPTYLGIVLLTVLVIPGTALVTGAELPDDLRYVDIPLQIPLAVVILVAAAAVLRARRRLTAVLMVGAIGYGIGGLFVVDGAPDLALAQFLVETLTLVAFVLVLRRLPVRFTQEAPKPLRWPKVVIACAGGLFIGVAAVVFSAARVAPPVASHEFMARAEEGAGATNVVNAIIVDFRAFDTVGEISVLAVAATGVASLVLASRFERRRRGARSTPGSQATSETQLEVRE